MRALGIVAICVVALIGAVSACWMIKYPTYVYRFRLNIAVEANGETKTGSSVIEIINRKQPEFGGAPGLLTSVRGEAVFVDLGGGRNVIATLGYGPTGASDSLPFLAPNVFRKRVEEVATLTNTQAELPEKWIPTLVTLGDLNDPMSASVVHPREFEQIFSPGIRFSRAWIEMTIDPVTRTLKERIPWLGNYQSETVFEQRLRQTGGGAGGSLIPGQSLSRGR